MKITKLEKQKKRKNRYNLFVDGDFFEGVEENTVAIFNLYVGKEVTASLLEEIRRVEEEEVLHSRMLAYLSRYRKTEKEAFDYILRKGYSETIAKKEIARLKEYKFLDDRKYVEDFVDYNEKYSKRMIRYKLRAKGISEELIDEILLKRFEKKKENEILERIFMKKMKLYKNKKDWKMRVIRALGSKGFSYDDINDLLRKYDDK